MTRELLVVAFHFPPLASSGTFRTLSFVRHLARLSWRSTVVTVRETDAAPRDEALLAQVPDGTRVVRVRSGDPVAFLSRLVRRPERKPRTAGEEEGAKGAPAAVRSSAAKRFSLVDAVTRFLQVPDKESPFQVTAAAAAVRAFAGAAPPDAVLASGPPMSGLVAGAIAARALGAPFVADFRDPWTANPFRDLPGPLLREWDAFLERFVLRTAAKAILNTAPARSALAAAHPEIAPDRLAVLENGFDPDELPDVPAPAGGPRDGRLTILHAGVLYGRRDPTPFLRALREVVAREDGLRGQIRVRFVGFPGDARFSPATLREAAGEDVVVSVEGSLPHAAALAEMIRSDVLLLLGVLGAGPEIQVPAKLFEYLATGRPILALCHPEGAIASVVRESTARAFSAPPEDEPAIAAALRDLLSAARRGEIVRGPSALPERFDRARQAERLDRILREACYSPDPQLCRRETPKS